MIKSLKSLIAAVNNEEHKKIEALDELLNLKRLIDELSLSDVNRYANGKISRLYNDGFKAMGASLIDERRKTPFSFMDVVSGNYTHTKDLVYVAKGRLVQPDSVSILLPNSDIYSAISPLIEDILGSKVRVNEEDVGYVNCSHPRWTRATQKHPRLLTLATHSISSNMVVLRMDWDMSEILRGDCSFLASFDSSLRIHYSFRDIGTKGHDIAENISIYEKSTNPQ